MEQRVDHWSSKRANPMMGNSTQRYRLCTVHMTCGSERPRQGKGLLICLPHSKSLNPEPCDGAWHKIVMALNPGTCRAWFWSHRQGSVLWGNTTTIKSVMRRGILGRSRRCPSLDYLRLKLFCISHAVYMVSTENPINYPISAPLSSISAPVWRGIRR